MLYGPAIVAEEMQRGLGTEVHAFGCGDSLPDGTDVAFLALQADVGHQLLVHRLAIGRSAQPAEGVVAGDVDVLVGAGNDFTTHLPTRKLDQAPGLAVVAQHAL